MPESLHTSFIHKTWIDLINAEAATGGILLIPHQHLCWSLFLIMLQQIRPATLLKLDSNKDVFCEICESFKNAFFEEHLPRDASTN